MADERDARYDGALRERVAALRHEGKSVRQIAEAVERSPTRVYGLLSELGLIGSARPEQNDDEAMP
jgi:hypothetical protein